MKQIPKDDRLKQLWLNEIKRGGKLPKEKNIVICSEHFTEDCFERNLRAEIENKSDKEIYMLKKDAVPTVFSFKKPVPPRQLSEKRAKLSIKRKIIDEAC